MVKQDTAIAVTGSPSSKRAQSSRCCKPFAYFVFIGFSFDNGELNAWLIAAGNVEGFTVVHKPKVLGMISVPSPWRIWLTLSQRY